MLKLIKLILLEKPFSTLHRVKTYMGSSVTQKHLSSCLLLASYKEQVDKRKLVEVANQFCFENEHHFSIKEQIILQEVYQKCCQGDPNLSESKVELSRNSDVLIL